MNHEHQLRGVLLAVFVISSGCTGLGLPSGPPADDQHSHEGGGSLNVSVAGDITPGNAVTIRATHDTEPVADADVYVVHRNGTRTHVGRTDEDGRLNVTVPESGHLSVDVHSDDLDGHYPSEHHPEDTEKSDHDH